MPSQGQAVQPITVEEEGIFLIRQRHSDTDKPIDTDTAADWIQAVGYEDNGRLISSPKYINSTLTPQN